MNTCLLQVDMRESYYSVHLSSFPPAMDCIQQSENAAIHGIFLEPQGPTQMLEEIEITLKAPKLSDQARYAGCDSNSISSMHDGSKEHFTALSHGILLCTSRSSVTASSYDSSSIGFDAFIHASNAKICMETQNVLVVKDIQRAPTSILCICYTSFPLRQIDIPCASALSVTHQYRC